MVINISKLLQKCKEREKSEKENSQQTELNIITLSMNLIPITDGQDFYHHFTWTTKITITEMPSWKTKT